MFLWKWKNLRFFQHPKHRHKRQGEYKTRLSSKLFAYAQLAPQRPKLLVINLLLFLLQLLNSNHNSLGDRKIKKHNSIVLKSLFREGMMFFAIRWEKGNLKKVAILPAYFFDPYRYRLHKPMGEHLRILPKHTFCLKRQSRFLKHLEGEIWLEFTLTKKTIPPWFIAAGFW